ncbi:hypothetical protein IE53DRAFT_384749 [Violaceomyces palustris]|uniref:Uncharacterized protein n=1 Tax=Violaceomyces palustris TaxID=1673888 RepID=A0ACD0P3U1_9BASI|nr:hypothetical protein IE53DRAFT_384749 [Violaceomyces palustris]
MWTDMASASLVFLILYFIVFVILNFLLFTGRIKFRSRWAVIYFHVAVRLASQACGLAFGILVWKNTQVLTAYFILGAEGYFTLVLCTARFLISWHNHHFGDSWLEHRRDRRVKLPWYQHVKLSFGISSIKERPFNMVEWYLIAANALIIAGGSLNSSAAFDDTLSATKRNSLDNTAKIMRTIGQSIFLAINVGLFVCIIVTVQQCRRVKQGSRWFGHPTLLLLILTWPFLATRGIFGVLQSAMPEFSYFNTDNFTQTGFTGIFLTEEFCMATMPEWVSCALLLGTYLTSRGDPPKPPIEEVLQLRGLPASIYGHSPAGKRAQSENGY